VIAYQLVLQCAGMLIYPVSTNCVDLMRGIPVVLCCSGVFVFRPMCEPCPNVWYLPTHSCGFMLLWCVRFLIHVLACIDLM
jgi:hypothetical protein